MDLMQQFADNAGRIEELEAEIKKANKAYYNSGKPVMSDAEYDALKDELRDIDPKHPLLSSVGVGVDESPWEDHVHEVPMSSLDKISPSGDNGVKDGFIDWVVKRHVKAEMFCVQDKLDGLSVSIEYLNGKLVRATTRGDGIKGEEITRNVVKMEGVPKQLKTGMTGFLRGEILMRHDKWKKHFSEMANPRNAASGVCRRLNGEGVEHLIVFFYDVIRPAKPFKTHIEKMQFLNNMLGLWTPHFYEADVPGVMKVYQEYEQKVREGLPYDIDGLVVKINDIEQEENLGRGGDDPTGNPRGQIALKFAHEMRKSTIERITWEVGKTGRVTPVAHIKPVRLAGARVEKASLHNVRRFHELRPYRGCKVLVSRRNDVIPHIEEVIDD